VKKALLYISFGLLCGLLAGGIGYLASRPPQGSRILLSPPPTPQLWVVQISGEVFRPGVYELPAESRVRDAVQAAGGLLPEADAAGINLAARLADGQSIVIQKSPSVTNPPGLRGDSFSTPFEPAPTRNPLPGMVNINTAGLDELDEIPNIGPAIAQRIIDYRFTNGPFTAIEEIMKVEGIGKTIFDEIKDLITVQP
jgi:competence protein ComEA